MTIFIMLLIIGVLYSIFSFLFSMLSGITGSSAETEIEAGADLEIGDEIDAEPAGKSDISSSGHHLVFFTVSPNMIAIAFIGFGLSGEALMRLAKFDFLPAIAGAVIIGYGLMFFVNNYIFLPLKRIDNSAKTAKCYVGAAVEVTENIKDGRLGSVRGTVNSDNFYYTAKSHDGTDLLIGEEAVVLSVEDNILIVSAVQNKLK